MPSDHGGDEVRGRPRHRALFPALAREVTGTQRLADVRARIDDADDPVPEDEWQAEVRMAVNFGLVTVSGPGSGDDRTARRTPFGDAWAALDRSAKRRGPWCLPGPGRFEVLFYPVPRRPEFPVFAATGPAVEATRQGCWNLVGGNTGAEPNPMTEVEMVSARRDGGTFSVWSTVDDPMLSALHLAKHDDARAVLDRVESALAERAAPWRVTPLTVDGTPREALVLDLRSDALPADVIGPPLLAVAHLDGATVTVISDAPADDLILTRIDPDDLVGPARAPTA